jgi:hypothetical protein
MMNEEEARPKRGDRLEFLLTVFVVLLVGVGSGMFVQHLMDQGTIAATLLSSDADRKRDAEAADKRERHLAELLETERATHEKDARDRHVRSVAFAVSAGRVRHELETLLSGARRDNESCTGRIAAISEDVGELDQLLGRSVGLLEKGQGKIRKLEADNAELSGKLAGWIRWHNEQHPEQITVTATKR